MDQQTRINYIVQTRKQSLLESIANNLVGFVIALVVQISVFPLFGIHIGLWDNLNITIVFTVVSVIRSYALRRFFNYLHTRQVFNDISF